MESPDTLSQVINQLRQQGYTEDLNRHEDNPLWLDPEAYKVDEIFRFEGPTNPDDESILYALSSTKYGTKGVLINGYGLSADALTAVIEARLTRWPEHPLKADPICLPLKHIS
ncbi:phosphoribosylpyrophosphate synthetase [Fibrivirga algicola]|uniref:phosphoribosylpyrophosphate synthetase n=1 Tax=Fibrivirga algicola TaxID=2950420 RepID=UPI001AAEEA05|nr:phosphoribosylpyrophosphate synthetase [Fibrivirga algicola]